MTYQLTESSCSTAEAILTAPTVTTPAHSAPAHASPPTRETDPLPWERLADVLLQREAALCRIVAGIPPRDFAGLFIGHADVDALLRTLPGLDGPAPGAVEPMREAFAHPLEQARTDFGDWVDRSDHGLARCARAIGLRRDEAEVLALLCAVELHPQRQRLVAYVQDSVQLPRLTLSTVQRMFGPDHLADRALAPGSRLVRAELVTVDEDAPWAVRMCRIPSRLLWALRDDDSRDSGLPGRARVMRPTIVASSAPDDAALLLVHGGDRTSRLLAAAARRRGAGLLVTGVPEARTAMAAIVREASVAGLDVVLELSGPPSDDVIARVEAADHLRWVFSSARELPLDALPQSRWTEVEITDGAAAPEDWHAGFGTHPPDAPRLDREQLRLVTEAADGDVAQVPRGVRRLAGGHLDHLAVRIRPRRSWSDLVLPTDQTSQLRELAARHRRRDVVHGLWGMPAVPSRGVVALFAGPSGTGKTLAAEVIAADLGLDLYKVDLAAVVSKWVGETEKNLGKVFDAASAGELLLFFDEADALFGKRSEVSDAHDRYANIEVGYLLQRLEHYDGLVLMATNLQRNIDSAFLRRISVAVDFAAPEEEQRRAIWARAFPDLAPTTGLDLAFLARQFRVSGAAIANAARTAAFLAAEEGTAIGMEHVVRGMKREFQKTGRMRTEAEFAHYYDIVRGEG
jgi:hypothetical protein